MRDSIIAAALLAATCMRRSIIVAAALLATTALTAAEDAPPAESAAPYVVKATVSRGEHMIGVAFYTEPFKDAAACKAALDGDEALAQSNEVLTGMMLTKYPDAKVEFTCVSTEEADEGQPT